MSQTLHHSKLWVYLLVALTVLIGAGLRFYRIEAQSLWYDEGNSAAMVGRSPAQIVQAAAGDIHPPLYYLLLAGWGMAAGKSELSLRLPSALAGIMTVAVIYRLGARLFRRTVGVLAGLLAAISALQVYYGQEARMYALVALLSAASVMLTIRVLEIPGEMVAGRFNPRRASVVVAGYMAVNAAGLYTHYTFPLVIAAETLIFLTWLIHRRSRLHGLATWLGLQIATLILFAPWLPTAIYQLETWPHLTAGAVDAPTIARTIFYGITLPTADSGMGLIALGLVAAVGLFPPLPGKERGQYLHFAERIGLVLAWLLVPLALGVWQGAIREPTLKFLLPCNLALALLIGRGAVMGLELTAPAPGSALRGSLVPRLMIPILLLVGLIPSVVGLQKLYTDPAYARDDYRAIAGRIREEEGSQAPVILDAPNQREVFTYYYPDGPGITPLPDATPVKTVIRVLQENQRVYAIFWGTEEQDPLGKVETALDRRAYVVDTTWYGKVRLVTYVAPDTPSDTVTHPIEAAFGTPPLIALTGFNLSSTSPKPGEALGVTLFWAAKGKIDGRLKVFVHLIAPDGNLVAQQDGEPRGGLSPTNSWRVDSAVIDHHGLILPRALAPGTYSLRVGLYTEPGGRLPVSAGGQPAGDTLILQSITVAP